MRRVAPGVEVLDPLVALAGQVGLGVGLGADPRGPATGQPDERAFDIL